MLISKVFRLNLYLLLSLFFLETITIGADWPAYRHDNARTGSTQEKRVS